MNSSKLLTPGGLIPKGPHAILAGSVMGMEKRAKDVRGS